MRSKVLEIIKMSVQKLKLGRPTDLNPDEEALVVVLTDIEGDHGLPIDINTLEAKLQLVIKSVNKRQSTKDITANSSSKYTHSVIKQFNHKEYGHDKQRNKKRTGLVKVSRLSNNRSRQSDPRLSLLMFHKIAHMYRGIREQESEEETELILNLRSDLNSNNTSFSSPITPKISIQQLTMPIDPQSGPEDLKTIQPRPSQVWN